MFNQFLFIYLLGALTFWPLVGLAVWYIIVNSPTETPSTPAVQQTEDEQLKPLQIPAKTENLQQNLDLKSNIEASGYLRLSPVYIARPEDEEVATEKANKTTFKRFVSSKFFSKNDLPRDESSQSLSSIALEQPKAMKVSKCPKYYYVVRGGQLQLFEDSNEKKILDIIFIPKYLVVLWPLNLQEFELFYKRHPILLMEKANSDNIENGEGVYLYNENGSDKEDLYFALIKESRRQTKPPSKFSLGLKDPQLCAQPYTPLRAEAQQLLSKVWNSDSNSDTQWLNGLLGRIFLAVKNTDVLDQYLRKKFNYKLKPISASSNMIGDIEIKSIDCGTSAPLITHVKLKELTTDGNFVASMGVSYSGGFKVILATNFKLAAISSLTSAEIPVELACTVTKLTGSMTIRIKPPPSDRIWYAFESMPDVDLHIEPTVYHKNISLSVVTKFIKSKLLDSLRDSMVYPYMDDFSFYDSTIHFYRGGIWFTNIGEGEHVQDTTEKQDAKQQQQFLPNDEKLPAAPTVTAVTASAPVTSTQEPDSTLATQPEEPAPVPFSYTRHPNSTMSPPSLPPKPLSRTSTSPAVRKPVPPQPTKVRTDVNLTLPDNSLSEEDYAQNISSYPNEGSFDLSQLKESPEPKVQRKPVPPPRMSKLELPSFTHVDASTELSNTQVEGELIEAEERPPSIERPASLRLRRQSIESATSTSSRPSLPPRNRKVVPLKNVAPEHYT